MEGNYLVKAKFVFINAKGEKQPDLRIIASWFISKESALEAMQDRLMGIDISGDVETEIHGPFATFKEAVSKME